MLIRVTARLLSPIVMRDELHLDSVMAAAHPDSQLTHIGRGDGPECLKTFPIPCTSIAWQGHSIPVCSAAQIDTGKLARDCIVRRKDGTDLDYLDAPFNPAFGPGKSRMVPFTILATPEIWWTLDGSWQGVKNIVRRILFLGGLRAQGYGAVREWKMTVVGEKQSSRVVAIHDGARALRNLPEAWCEWAEDVRDGACSSPYWHPARRERIVPAGTRCVLKADVELKAQALALTGEKARMREQASHERWLQRQERRSVSQ